MNCPRCESPKCRVKDSRVVELNVYRQRVCRVCGYTFYTEETELDDNEGLRYFWRQDKQTRKDTHT